MTTCVVYKRVSSTKQATHGYGLDEQEADCTRVVAAQGWRRLATFTDQQTGDDESRPALDEMLAYLEAHSVDYVVAAAVDRFGRGDKELDAIAINTMRAIANLGVGVHTADAGNNELAQSMLGVLAGYAKRQMLKRTKAGKRASAKAGNIHGRAPLGYTKHADPEQGRYWWEVDADEAKVVQRIFSMYANDRMSIHAIAMQLRAERVPTWADRKRGRLPTYKWRTATVAGMLGNEVYAGKHVWGGITNTVPAIVDQTLFDKTQQLRQRNGQRHNRHKGEPPRAARYGYLLRDHVVCGHCGKRMHGLVPGDTPNFWYRCRGATHKPKLCDMRDVNGRRTDRAVGTWLLQLVADPAVVEQYITDELARHKVDAKTKRQLATYRQDEQALETEVARYLALYGKGTIDQPTLDQQVQATQDQLRQVRLQAAELAASMQPFDAKAFREDWQATVGELQQALGTAWDDVAAWAAEDDGPDAQAALAELAHADQVWDSFMPMLVDKFDVQVTLHLDAERRPYALACCTLGESKSPIALNRNPV